MLAVYVEATADDTETRLLNGLRKRCPQLATSPATYRTTTPNGLVEMLAALRQGHGIPVGKKVLIVLDQFEQWLHAKKDEPDTELVRALRQCDGVRVQCVVMVRDDFWLAVSRFLRDLEVRLLEGHNSALVDLFDLDHARRVLKAFGRAFGRIPETMGSPERINESSDNEAFVENAVVGLAQEGKVISVRLSLFAEMMKGSRGPPRRSRRWVERKVSASRFLEETFSATGAPPEHRYHQKAARAVLRSLLPEAGPTSRGTCVRGTIFWPPPATRRARKTSTTSLAPRFRNPVDFPDRPGRQSRFRRPGSRKRFVAPRRWAALSTDARLSGPGTPRLANAETAGDDARAAELLLAERTATWSTRPGQRNFRHGTRTCGFGC